MTKKNLLRYTRGAALPGRVLPWETETAQDVYEPLDLSTGYTFTLYLIDADGVTALTKTAGLAGANGSVTVTWGTSDLDLPPGLYTLRLRAVEDATSKPRWYRTGDELELRIDAAPA